MSRNYTGALKLITIHNKKDEDDFAEQSRVAHCLRWSSVASQLVLPAERGIRPHGDMSCVHGAVSREHSSGDSQYNCHQTTGRDTDIAPTDTTDSSGSQDCFEAWVGVKFWPHNTQYEWNTEHKESI